MNTDNAPLLRDLAAAIADLSARVAALEAQHATRIDAAPMDPAATTWLEEPPALLMAVTGTIAGWVMGSSTLEPPALMAVVGTPGTSWQPGGWVDQYCQAEEET